MALSAQVFAWSHAKSDVPAVLAAACGMGLAVLAGVALGHPAWGLAAAIGGMLASHAGTGGSLGAHLRLLAPLLAASGLAALVAGLAAGHGVWTELAVVAAGGLAALAGGYSRPLGLGAGRFIIFLPILLGAAESHPAVLDTLLLALGGAVLTMGLALLFGALARALGWHPPPPPEPGRLATRAQLFRRWRQTLGTWAGWQYPLRLMACLAAAGALHLAWPEHHLRWVTLTVAILAQRTIEMPPLKTLQRALGAMLGVAAAGLLVFHPAPPGWDIAALIALFGGLAPWLRGRNYLAFTACTTPLIMVMFSAGGPIEPGLLADRLVATLMGAGLVLAADMLASRPLGAN
ncbi:FUSC family protein [Acetobacteraceae bacterium H6797]|nr:FUSC family protein [Acetobacteraceae bacterium H6797]